jgi:mono/diheme cytochrome c family protein
MTRSIAGRATRLGKRTLGRRLPEAKREISTFVMQRCRLAALIALAVVLIGVAVLVYRLAIPGLSSARQAPPAAEVTIATWLLHESVPAEARGRINPLSKDPAAIAAGQDLFRQKCAVCHAYDGSGKTEIGAGEYPRPPALRSMNIMALMDGEIFYHIRNGMRNTGMPAWSMLDDQV